MILLFMDFSYPKLTLYYISAFIKLDIKLLRNA